LSRNTLASVKGYRVEYSEGNCLSGHQAVYCGECVLTV